MRKIYSAVKLFFIAISLAAIGSVVSNIDSLSAIGGLMSLAGGVMTIVSLYQLRYENQRFAKAVRAVWLYIGTAVVVVVALVAMLVQIATGDVGILMMVIVAALCILMLVMVLRLQYFTYSGFEEMRETRGIDYPPRRIMWCFYLTILSMVITFVSVTGIVAMLVGGALNGGEAAIYEMLATLELVSDVMLVVGVVIEAIHLWLMFTYMQAVRAAEENEARERWDSMQ